MKYHRFVVANTKHLTNIFELVRYIFPWWVLWRDVDYCRWHIIYPYSTALNYLYKCEHVIVGGWTFKWRFLCAMSSCAPAFHSFNIALGWCLKRAFSLPLAHMDLHASFHMHCAQLRSVRLLAHICSYHIIIQMSHKDSTNSEIWQLSFHSFFSLPLFFSLSHCSYSVSLTAFRS